MSEDFSNNIDDQLLRAAKQQGVGGLDQSNSQSDLSRVKLEALDTKNLLLAEAQHLSQLQQHQQQQQQQQHHHQQQHHLPATHHQHPHAGVHGGANLGPGPHQPPSFHTHGHPGTATGHTATGYDDTEYNIQIPEPIINAKLKIYPVAENTITAEGNLITRPYPDHTFHDRKDLNDFINEFARDNGFGVVIAHSNKKAIYYTCELGGRYRDKKNKKNPQAAPPPFPEDYFADQDAKTKKLKCPFSMTASFRKQNQSWLLRTTCNEHNHPQLDPLSNHPMLRKRSNELNLLIVDLYKSGTKPSHIESKIKERFPDILIKREDIYNEIRGYKRKLKRENGFMSNPDSRFRKRSNANSFHQVDNMDDEDDVDEKIHMYDRNQNDVDLEGLQQAAAAAVQQHQNNHPQNLTYQPDNATATALAAVANANANNHHSDQISMDNIDSRLVGE